MEEPKKIGDWLLICVLGAGSFGKVTLWRNHITEEHIAIKRCKYQLPSNLSVRQKERWINEVEIMKAMKNDNIIAHKELPKILEEELEKYNPTKLPILSMEYCCKGNLRKFLAQIQNLKGCEESDVKCILQDIGNAILYLHSKNITHRDIKPENIVIQEHESRPGKSIYKIIDLGYAKELETILSFVGTLPYVAPEIFHNLPYTKNVDYWSLGILTYEIITGEHPFLINKPPVERFKYLKEKSDKDISVSLSRDGSPKYSNTITAENQLSSILKADIEKWLRLLLVYDCKKRGLCNKEERDIFNKLDLLLKKKTLKVFSIFHYCTVDYEIIETTKLSDIKQLIESNLDIPRNEQIFILDKETVIRDDNIKLIELFENTTERTLFVFKKNDDFILRTVNVPQYVQALFQPINTQMAVTKKLYSHAIFFINQEKKLMEQFQIGILLQIAHTSLLFKSVKKLHCDVRSKLLKLTIQIECYGEFDDLKKPHIYEDQQYIKYLAATRKNLRQVKELIENFNSLTGRLLEVLKMEWICSYAESLRKALNSTEIDMKNMYNNAITLYQKITASNSYLSEMTQILSTVLKIPRTAIFSNNDLKKYIRCSLFAQKKLPKLFTWCKAMDEEVKKLTHEMLTCEKIKYEYTQNICSRPNKITVPDGCSDVEELNELLKENLDLRYKIQEISDEGSSYIRNLQADIIYFWNGISRAYTK